MKTRNTALRGRLSIGLAQHKARRSMRGLPSAAERDCFIEQLIESVRRVEYIAAIRTRRLSASRCDPSTAQFDPLKGALVLLQRGDLDEAFWLVFLFVHFGKHLKDGYRLARDVYSGNGPGQRWTWKRTSSKPERFTAWLEKAAAQWKHDGVRRRFGNHRKYETLKTTGSVVESYVEWVGVARSHVELVRDAYQRVGADRGERFDDLYQSMSAVKRFGRMAKFDYLTMLGKLGLADIEPPSTYVREATGPLSGARLLYRGDASDSSRDDQLDDWLIELGRDLGVGQQVVEDAVCNWQKSPMVFRAFRG